LLLEAFDAVHCALRAGIGVLGAALGASGLLL
jgi:hypothetical protein